jgi:hypothetical protein
MVSLLLEHGGDPNQRWRGKTLFQQVLSLFGTYDHNSIYRPTDGYLGSISARGVVELQERSEKHRKDLAVWAVVFKTLLKHGAGSSRLAYSHSTNDFDFFKAVIIGVFDRYLPSAVSELNKELNRRLKLGEKSNSMKDRRRKRSVDDAGPTWPGASQKRHRPWR